MSNLFLLISLLSLLIIYHPSNIRSEILPFQNGREGEWRLLRPSIGISAMHMQLLHNNKVVAFDRTDFGLSSLSLPGGRCRYDSNDTALEVDCTAHSVLYDVETNSFRPLMVQTDTWCSSGAISPSGSLIQTGGFNDGDRAVRIFTPCDADSCDWVEFPGYLSQRRWYATNQILPDGRIIIIGGRREFNYEFYPKNEDPYSASSGSFWLRFLMETRDESENNLYPFVHLLPDGNLFIFANTRSISLDYNRNRVVKEFPSIPIRDPRNYPSSGSSVLLPVDENKAIEAEIMICGGAPRGAFIQASQGNFARASSSCGRLKVSDDNPRWAMENMPIARVMGDMLLLATGDIIIINGVEHGTAGWELGQSPVTRPVIYKPNVSPDWRFAVMSASSRPRLYHSTAILLSDGRVLVGGSNPHRYYNFTNVDYPTDLSLEAFSPPYLSIEHKPFQPQILSVNDILPLGQPFSLTFCVPLYLSEKVISIRIIAPSFTTHSLAMNQRMVVLKLEGVSRLTPDSYNLTAVGPSTAEIAPPGYYMLFVVHAGIPSNGSWVRIQ